MKDEEKKKCSCGEEDCKCDDNCDCGDDCDCGDEIVELTGEDGKVLKFYHLGTIEYKKAYYAAFSPAEEVEGLDNDELVIYQISGEDEENSELIPIEDQDLLDEVYEEFCKAMDEDECDSEEECDCEDECDCEEECEDENCDCGCHDKK